jgi:hypothetical protein
MRFLPGLFENLDGQVDGLIALDDGSVDGSRAFVEEQTLTVEVLSVPTGSQELLEDAKNHRTLTEAAWEHGPAWLLGIDADERVERNFRRRALREIRRASSAGHSALWVPFRELWNGPDTVRTDGVWGGKRKACLFESDRNHRFDDRRLHAIWAPWPPPDGDYPTADLRLYHLRMIRPEDRRARVERYRELDPDARWQEIGYDYLLDEGGIVLDPLEAGRHYRPLGR